MRINWDERRADGKVRAYSKSGRPMFWVSPEYAREAEEADKRRHDEYRAMAVNGPFARARREF